jgi:hypothetical protein
LVECVPLGLLKLVVHVRSRLEILVVRLELLLGVDGCLLLLPLLCSEVVGSTVRLGKVMARVISAAGRRAASRVRRPRAR